MCRKMVYVVALQSFISLIVKLGAIALAHASIQMYLQGFINKLNYKQWSN